MITLTSWADVKAYFSDLGYSHPALATQADGRGMVLKYADRRLDREPGTNRYPLLEVGPPRYQAEIDPRGGRRGKRYRVEFSVLTAVALDDYRGQELAHESLEPVIDQLLAKMRKDKVIAAANWEVYQVSNESHDDLWGWTTTVDVLVAEGFCYDMNEWNDLVRLRPVWTPGQTQLGVSVNSISFSVSWTENTYAAMVAAVRELAAQISASEGAGTDGWFDAAFFSSDFFDTGEAGGANSDGAGDPDPAHLVIIGREPGSVLLVETSPGHAWVPETSVWLLQ